MIDGQILIDGAWRESLGGGTIALFLAQVTELGGKVIFGTLIIVAGIMLARVIAGLVGSSTGEGGYAQTIVRYAIIALFTAIGLTFMGLANEIVILAFGLILGSAAIATALATRLPLVVNLVTCLLIYFMGHLTPVLVQIARRRQANDPNSAVAQLLTFMAQVFDTIVPSLDLFKIDSALLSDVPPPIDQFFLHVGQAAGLAVLYTVIALLLGLILFEDRDLA